MLATLNHVLSYLGRLPGQIPQQEGQISFLLPKADKLVKDFVGYTLEQQTFQEYYPDGGPNIYSDDDLLIMGYEMLNGKAVPFSRGDNAREVLFLNQLPATSIISVIENPGAWATPGGNFPVSATLDPSSYYLDVDTAGFSTTGALWRWAGAWTTARRCIQVTYQAGYTPVQLDPTTGTFPQFSQAVVEQTVDWLMLAVMKNRAAISGGMVQQESLDGWNVSFMPPQVWLAGVSTNKLSPKVAATLEPYFNPRRYIG